MKIELAKVAIVVDDYDKAIDYYTNKLPFELVEDTALSPEKRWVVIKPKNAVGCHLLLAKAKNEKQAQAIGNQTGGRVFLFLYTDNIKRDEINLKKNMVKIVRFLEQHDYGSVLVFEDLYGNLWDLIQPVSVI